MYGLAFVLLVPFVSYDLSGSLAVTPLIVLAGAVFAARLADREADQRVAMIIRAGYALKVVASGAYYILVFGLTGGDAAYYHERGAAIASAVWGGRFTEALSGLDVGTPAMEAMTGVLYSVIGPTSAGAFAVFAIISFVGVCLFLRAFTIAVPRGNRRLFAALAFLYPSMLFWPSALGKDSWMLLGLGLASYGAARLLNGRRGVVPLLAGVGAAGLLRPHMAAMAVVALLAAPLAGERPQLSRRVRRARVVLFVTVVVSGAFATVVALRTFGLPGLSPGEISAFLGVLAEHTGTGGSEFSNIETTNPLLAPVAIVSVLFRPFPHEARSILMLITSLEALVLAGFFWRYRASIRAAMRSFRRNGYMAYTLIYTFLFGLAYSYFNNLGLLARERVQLLPFVFVILAFATGRGDAAAPAR